MIATSTQSVSAPKGAAWRDTVRSDDIDLHAKSQTVWNLLQYDQLSAGAFCGEIDQMHLPGVCVIHEAANRSLRQRGETVVPSYGFAIVKEKQGDVVLNGQRIEHPSILVGRCDDLDLCSSSGFQLVGVVVDGGLINSLSERMFCRTLSPWLDRQVVVQTSLMTVERILNAMLQAYEIIGNNSAIFDDATALGLMRDAVLSEWLNALPAEVDTADLKSIGARRRVVDRACELMRSQPEEPMSMLQVCSRIGASQRKLSYCFQDMLGISPAKYLRAIRLNAVRRELKHPTHAGVTVQDVASHWGFWHLGQFSTDYKRQFAELPSETLRTVRLTSLR